MAETKIQWGPMWMTPEEVARAEAAGHTNPTPPKPQPALVEVLSPTDLVNDVPARRLRKDVMGVYKRLGGEDWLHNQAVKNPELVLKLLLKLLPQTVEADVRQELVISHDVTSLTTAELKLMLLKQAAKEQKDDPTL
jgi:hypothetical protein